MMIARIEGAGRVLGKKQGYIGLPVRDDVFKVTGVFSIPIEETTLSLRENPNAPCMVTAWHPTPKELQALIEGASIHVTLLGSAHPPILVEVGPVPQENPYGTDC